MAEFDSEMTRVELTTGFDNPLLPQLKECIQWAEKIDLVVAFVRLSGLELIYRSLEDALERGASLRMITGDYLYITEPAALNILLELQAKYEQASIRVYESRGTSFHPKAYIFYRLNALDLADIEKGVAYVGSSNLSRAALLTGVEWNIGIDAYQDPLRFIRISDAFESLYLSPESCSLTRSWLDAYRLKFAQSKSEAPVRVDGETAETPVPTQIQSEALQALAELRHSGAERALIVLATGIGKTWLSAFDTLAFQQHQPGSPFRILFVAHRQEILQQAEISFLKLYPQASTQQYQSRSDATQADILFASIQSLGRQADLAQFSIDHFNYIIVDEFHHAAAQTYQALLAYFQPQFLLGLTATPERSDQADILSLCDGNLAYQVDALEGIHRDALAPFHYYGIHDQHVDYTRVSWRRGQFSIADLEQAYTQDSRAAHILSQWRLLGKGASLGFCVSIAHADYMAVYFQQQGISAASVHTQSQVQRDQALEGLISGLYAIVFSVDLFNEGVDIPCLETVLLLRPTESKVLFLQQLGRGLRKYPPQPDKVLHVLDFIGNHHVFLNRAQALFRLDHSPQSISRWLKQLVNQTLSLPQNCTFEYDLSSLNFFQNWAEQSKDQRLKRLFENLYTSLGDRPRLLDMVMAGADLNAIKKAEKSWWQFLDAQNALSDIEQQVLVQYGDFLAELEKTQMTKSFKMICLEAFNELQGWVQGANTVELAMRSLKLLQRRKHLHDELPDWVPRHSDVELDSQQHKDWLAYWLKNPVSAWCGKGNQKTSRFFELKGESLFASFQVDAELREPLVMMMQELIQYRLFAHAPNFIDPVHRSYPAKQYERFSDWLADQSPIRVPLFACEPEQPLRVKTHTNKSGHLMLCRSPEMETAIIERVEQGLLEPAWEGLLYLVFQAADEHPCLLAECGRRGRGANLNVNLSNLALSRNKFARWGDSSAYFFGQMSQALRMEAEHKGSATDPLFKQLFESADPPTLKSRVELVILPWYFGQRNRDGQVIRLSQLKTELKTGMKL